MSGSTPCSFERNLTISMAPLSWQFYDMFTSHVMVRVLEQGLNAVGRAWQWFVLIRKHAAAVVEDSTVFPLFQRFCKVCPPHCSIQESKYANLLRLVIINFIVILLFVGVYCL